MEYINFINYLVQKFILNHYFNFHSFFRYDINFFIYLEMLSFQLWVLIKFAENLFYVISISLKTLLFENYGNGVLSYCLTNFFQVTFLSSDLPKLFVSLTWLWITYISFPPPHLISNNSHPDCSSLSLLWLPRPYEYKFCCTFLLNNLVFCT